MTTRVLIKNQNNNYNTVVIRTLDCIKEDGPYPGVQVVKGIEYFLEPEEEIEIFVWETHNMLIYEMKMS
jgi:hypothetical protein